MAEEKQNLYQRILSPTPKKWASISKLSFKLVGTFTAAWAAVATLGISYPPSVGYVMGVLIFIGTSVGTYCQQKVEPEPTKES